MNRRMKSGWLFCVLQVIATPGWREDGRVEWAPAGQEFAVDAIRPQCGWITEAEMLPGRWKPVVQPNLAARIKDAPELKLDDVAPPPERCWVGRRPYLVPNPDGRSWDMVYPYFNRYGGVQVVVIHDFGSGKTARKVLSTRDGNSVLTRERIDFHMQPSFYTDGKLVKWAPRQNSWVK